MPHRTTILAALALMPALGCAAPSEPDKKDAVSVVADWPQRHKFCDRASAFAVGAAGVPDQHRADQLNEMEAAAPPRWRPVLRRARGGQGPRNPAEILEFEEFTRFIEHACRVNLPHR